MRSPTILSSLPLGASLLIGDAMLAPSFARDSPAAPTPERQWLSIAQMHQRLEAAGFRNVERIEREHGVYEARATDRHGVRVKLHINPQNGEVIERSDPRKPDREGAPGERRQHDRAASSSVECSERRCRDDLPQRIPPAQVAAR